MCRKQGDGKRKLLKAHRALSSPALASCKLDLVGNFSNSGRPTLAMALSLLGTLLKEPWLG
jgi:hypothetical protein